MEQDSSAKKYRVLRLLVIVHYEYIMNIKVEEIFIKQILAVAKDLRNITY